MKKTILDVACGGKSFYFNKENPKVLFCDIRNGKFDFPTNRVVEINPDIICDFTKLPFKNKKFNMVVFDPPHLIHGGQNSWLVKKYGILPKDWQETIKKGFDECWRVLKPKGCLIFKWNETQITVSEILNTIGKQPLLGHKSGKQNKTHWLVFYK
mgnify:CR=1 FL=1